ncbi:hypothetical protein UPYG_G00092600 [Umbra pygmaea]|uniref:Fibulin-2-like n=1 Tax=Umbra pygmaea TaxID=75934 RepID=A0ABD0XGE8_UMBPY
MPCPEVPANCMEVSDPADGCVTCKQIGCVHDDKMYEAGHSFLLDPCQVCHCPTNGGKMMCFPAAECDPSGPNDPSDPHKPMPPTTQEDKLEGETRRNIRLPLHPYSSQDGSARRPVLREPEQGHLPASPYNQPPFPFNSPHLPPDLLTKPYLPLFKSDRRMDEDEEMDEDYDYPPTDTAESPLDDVPPPTESSFGHLPSFIETKTPLPRYDRGYDGLVGHHGSSHYDRRHKQEQKERDGLPKTTTQSVTNTVRSTGTDRLGQTDVIRLTGKDRVKQRDMFRQTDKPGQTDIFRQKSYKSTDRLMTDRSKQTDRLKLSDKITDSLMTFGLYKATTETDIFRETEGPTHQTASNWLEDTVEESTSHRSLLATTTTSPWNNPPERHTPPDLLGARDEDAEEDGWERGMEGEEEHEEGTVFPLENTTRPGWRDVDKQRRGGVEMENWKNDQMREEKDKTAPGNHVKSAVVRESRHHQNNASVEHSTTFPRMPQEHTVRTTTLRQPEHGILPAAISPRTHQAHTTDTNSLHYITLKSHPKPKELELHTDRTTDPKELELHTDRTTDPRELELITDRTTDPRELELITDRTTAPRELELITDRTTAPRELELITDRTTTPRQAEYDSFNRQPENHTQSKFPDSQVIRSTTPRVQTIHKKPDQHAVVTQSEPHHPSSRPPVHHYTTTRERFSTASQPPVRGSANARILDDNMEEERVFDPLYLPKPQEGLSSIDEVERCCEAGRRWATEQSQCHMMPVWNEDKHSVCSIAQQHCCRSVLKESSCLAGLTAAQRGDRCEMEQGNQCAADSYQVCCSCCALGLALRSEGRGCEAHRYLGYPCGHVLLTCCEKEEGLTHSPAPALKRKEWPGPATLPNKVPDRELGLGLTLTLSAEEISVLKPDGEQPVTVHTPKQPEDVDECELYLGKLCHHTCVNTRGSYQCTCHHGYTLQQDLHTCSPVSLEEDNEGPPSTINDPQQPCRGKGPCMQQCSVVADSVRCTCYPGFYLMTDGHNCEDVDECVTSSHSCQSSERCVNTWGSFVCERKTLCPGGYQLRSGVCEDIDECMIQSHNCDQGFECQNTVGSFLCQPKPKCVTGFSPDSHGNCIDINECSSVSEPCSAGFTCINTVGSYTCQRRAIMCSPGHHASLDGTRCIDVDECLAGAHGCGQGQICHNLPGSYRCDCQTGYQFDALRQHCTDVNECWRYPGRLCAQLCDNTPGSYQCSCATGFSLAFDGKNCEDVNECDSSPCEQQCANIYGSYQCYCTQGFYLMEDGHTCGDIDECSQSIGNLCLFQCVNVPGSYQCACPPTGYTMSTNRRTCIDIDECATGSHNCSSSQSCYNVQGGYKCLYFSCPSNYRKVSDMRCERNSCPVHSHDCQSSPLRITYYQLSFPTNIVIPAQVFRIGPSPAYSGDNIAISIINGNEENYFSTRKLNSFTGAVYLQREVREPKDFLIDVEMKLLRQGTFTSFLARIYVFITANTL